MGVILRFRMYSRQNRFWYGSRSFWCGISLAYINRWFYGQCFWCRSNGCIGCAYSIIACFISTFSIRTRIGGRWMWRTRWRHGWILLFWINCRVFKYRPGCRWTLFPDCTDSIFTCFINTFAVGTWIGWRRMWFRFQGFYGLSTWACDRMTNITWGGFRFYCHCYI